MFLREVEMLETVQIYPQGFDSVSIAEQPCRKGQCWKKNGKTIGVGVGVSQALLPQIDDLLT